jgi:putative pyoverdin transport system ATP-binding/permease protein
MLKKLIKARYSDIKKYFLLVLCYAGADIGMVIICNIAIVSLFKGKPELRQFLLFIILMSLLLFVINVSAKKASRLIEGIVSDFRTRIIKTVMAAELESFERIGSSAIYSILTRETQVISLIANRFVHISRILILVIGYVVVLFVVCPPGFFSAIICFGIGAAVYAYRIILAKNEIILAREKEKELFSSIEALLYGFKELRINDKKNEGFFIVLLLKNQLKIENTGLKRKSFL